jgi:hypothetical protein
MDEATKAIIVKQIEAMVSMATAADHLRMAVEQLQNTVTQLTALLIRMKEPHETGE